MNFTKLNDARLASFRKNSRLMKGVRWLATLDASCCLRCAALDGLAWDLDGKPISGNTVRFVTPALHDACRCVISPIPKTFRDIGLDIDEPTDPGQRASSLGPISGGTGFGEYLRLQSADVTIRLMGPERGAMFLSGDATLRDMIDDDARVVPLVDLRALLAKRRAQSKPAIQRLAQFLFGGARSNDGR